jgi:hypothetical protein
MLLESTKELSIEKLESLVPNVSRAFRLTTETQCDAIFPAEDSFPPGARRLISSGRAMSMACKTAHLRLNST